MAIAREITRSYISKDLDFEKLDISRYQASIVMITLYDISRYQASILILAISVIKKQRTLVEKVKERGREKVKERGREKVKERGRDSKEVDVFERRPAQETYTDK